MKIIINKKIDKKDMDNASFIFSEKKKDFKLKRIYWDYPPEKQFVIYLYKNKFKIGMLRVIRKKIYLNKKFYSVACITSVGIFPNFRKSGFARILMKKSNLYLKNKFDISLLIARRKLDFFYNKFNFLGYSEFYSIKFKFSNLPSITTKLMIRKKKIINNKLIRLYLETNKKKNGYFKRNKNDWKIINKKISLGKFSIKEFKYKNNCIGYVVYKKNCIFEYGYKKKFLEFFILAINNSFKDIIEIKNPDMEIVNQIKNNNEINIYRRQCVYGGHMINIYNSKHLKNISYNINLFDEF